jgi:hypothetical protein
MTAELVDDGQGLGYLVCVKCKACADILERLPRSEWPGNDLPPLEALGETLPQWMRRCHSELLPASPSSDGAA